MGENTLKIETLKENQEDKVMNKNMEKCLKFVGDRYSEITTEEKLTKALLVMSEENRKVFEGKWGLDSGEYCGSYKKLNAKLGIENSETTYKNALKEFAQIAENLKYAEIFESYEVEEFKLASCYGQFLATVYLRYKRSERLDELKSFKIPFKEIKERCIRALNTLPETERALLILKFGLQDGKIKTQSAVSETFNITSVKIRKIEAKAFTELKSPHRKEIFEKNEEDFVCLQHFFSATMCMILYQAKIYTLEDFKQITPEECIKRCKCLGEKGKEEIFKVYELLN